MRHTVTIRNPFTGPHGGGESFVCVRLKNTEPNEMVVDSIVARSRLITAGGLRSSGRANVLSGMADTVAKRWRRRRSAS